MSDWKHQTQSLCPDCKKILPATLYRHNGDVWIARNCPTHGQYKGLYWRDHSLFDQMSGIVGDYTWCTSFECLKNEACDRCLENNKTYNIMIEVTNSCNLDCPVCCSDANSPYSGDPTIEQILDRLPKPDTLRRRGLSRRFKRPNVVLFGGEPTVRKDLPELIRAIVARGYIPRLTTNGVRLTDENYLKELKDAGLNWIILQFDGFDNDVSEQFRGERLVEKKLDAIKKLTRHKFKIQLATMAVNGANSHYIGDILQFTVSNPNIFWMGIYPVSAQSRHSDRFGETHVADVVKQIEASTSGQVRRKDFINTMKILGILFSIFRSPNLRQKLSILPMVMLVKGNRTLPLVRFLNPLFAIRHIDLTLQFVLSIPKLVLYQEEPTPSFIKFLIIEKFHADATVDLEEASNCHMAFVTHQNYIPFDLYNIHGKKFGAWPQPAKARKKTLTLPSDNSILISENEITDISNTKELETTVSIAG